MHAFRRNRLRRWVAGSVAVIWLFTVGACALEGPAIESGASQAVPLSTGAPVAPHQKGDLPDDDCCQLQSTALGSFSAPTLPAAMIFVMIVPLLLLILAPAPLTGAMVETRSLSPPVLRWQHFFLVHSLQPQAPPR